MPSVKDFREYSEYISGRKHDINYDIVVEGLDFLIRNSFTEEESRDIINTIQYDKYSFIWRVAVSYTNENPGSLPGIEMYLG